MSCQQQTPESNEKRRQTLLLKREAQSERQRNNWLDPEYRARVSANMLGHPTSEIARARLSKTSKASWANPEIRQRRIEGLRAAMHTREWREKRRAIAKRLWADPDFRARMKAAKGT